MTISFLALRRLALSSDGAVIYFFAGTAVLGAIMLLAECEKPTKKEFMEKRFPK